MNDFFRELLHDLREKRLLPVALVLLVALVAVPVVMLKPAASPEADDAAVAPVKAKTTDNALELDASEPTANTGSSLSSFDPKNPFKSLLKRSNGSTALADVAKAAASDSNSGASPNAGGGSSGGSGGGGTSPAPHSQPKRRAERFTYVIDVTFVRNGKLRKIRGLQKLDMLPSRETPLLLFVGVDKGRDDAVFLVDSNLKTTGEGSCKPSASECGAVAIGPGAEQIFTDDAGNSYQIRVDEIRKVSLARARSAKAKAAKRRAANRLAERRAKGATGSGGAKARGLSPQPNTGGKVSPPTGTGR